MGLNSPISRDARLLTAAMFTSGSCFIILLAAYSTPSLAFVNHANEVNEEQIRKMPEDQLVAQASKANSRELLFGSSGTAELEGKFFHVHWPHNPIHVHWPHNPIHAPTYIMDGNHHFPHVHYPHVHYPHAHVPVPH